MKITSLSLRQGMVKLMLNGMPNDKIFDLIEQYSEHPCHMTPGYKIRVNTSAVNTEDVISITFPNNDIGQINLDVFEKAGRGFLWFYYTNKEGIWTGTICCTYDIGEQADWIPFTSTDLESCTINIRIPPHFDSPMKNQNFDITISESIIEPFRNFPN